MTMNPKRLSLRWKTCSMVGCQHTEGGRVELVEGEQQCHHDQRETPAPRP